MFHIIVNPASSSGQGLKRWREIEPYFQKSGRPYKVHFPSGGCSISRIVRQVTKELCSLVILGGDGTVNEAVNSISDFSNVRFGFIPIGSGNDLARSIGLSEDHHVVVKQILEDRIMRTCDIGEVFFHNRIAADSHSTERRLFNISCGIGYDAAICYASDHSKLKPVLNVLHIGSMVYFSEALGELFRSQMVPCKIVADNGFALEKDSMLFTVIMNQRFEGGGFAFCPEAYAEDGILDLCTVADIKNRLEFFRLFPKVLTGTHVKEKSFTLGRASSFDIRTGEPLFVHTDGEVHCKSSHMTITLAKEKLKMLI